MATISIHSSHTGRDIVFIVIGMQTFEFQSTLPIREETFVRPADSGRYNISIHSSHTGRDRKGVSRETASGLFQSTLPIREETAKKSIAETGEQFQSTLPIREETTV